MQKKTEISHYVFEISISLCVLNEYCVPTFLNFLIFTIRPNMMNKYFETNMPRQDANTYFYQSKIDSFIVHSFQFWNKKVVENDNNPAHILSRLYVFEMLVF